MHHFGLGLILLLTCTACGESEAPRRAPPAATGTTPRPQVPIRPEDTVPPIARKRPAEPAPQDNPPVEPVRAKDLYESPTPSTLGKQLRAQADEPAYVPPASDARWVEGVQAALKSAAIEAPARARSVAIGAGVLDLVDARGPNPQTTWVHIERWRGEPAQVLEERAALFTTAVSHAGVLVEPVDLSGLTAYRSNLDDPQRPALAWLHKELFVRVGTGDVSAATAIHAALERARAYGEPAVAERRPDPVVPSPSPSPGKARPGIVGRWILTNGTSRVEMRVDAGGTWRTFKLPDRKKAFSSGTWKQDADRYALVARRVAGSDIPPETTIGRLRDGKLILSLNDGEELTASRARPTAEPNEKFEESFGAEDGLSDAPFTGADKAGTKGGEQAYLGVFAHELDASTAEIYRAPKNGGVLLSHVERDSPAHRAGLRALQVIVSLGEHKVRSAEDVEDALSAMSPGQRVLIRRWRLEPVTVQLGSTQERPKIAPEEQQVMFGLGESLFGPEVRGFGERGFRLSSMAGVNGRWMMAHTQAGAERLQAIFFLESPSEVAERARALAGDGWMLTNVEFDGRGWATVHEKGDVQNEQQLVWSPSRKDLAAEVRSHRKRGFYVTDLAQGAGQWVAVFTKQYYAPNQRVVSLPSTREFAAAVQAQYEQGWRITQAACGGDEWFLVLEKRPRTQQSWMRTDEADLTRRLPKRWEEGFVATVLCAGSGQWLVVFDREP